MKKVTMIALIAICSLLVAGLAAGGYVYFDFVRAAPGTSETDVIYEVQQGRGFNAVAKDLESLGLIKNAEFFSIYARLRGQRSQMKVGEYALRANMTPDDVLAVITSGKSVARPFTVAEGLNIYEIADLYEHEGFGKRAEFLALAKDKQFATQLLGEPIESLEGYLFPETYMITKYESTRDLLTAMVKRFNAVEGELGLTKSLPGWSRRQIVILASIIEKETGARADRALVASVFHNRLQKRMKLQTDPTIIYGIADVTGVIPTDIHKDDILKPTRYNTYVIPGLPPGPISNPGRESLMAAIKPAMSKYLYFVSKNDGTTQFSESLDVHNKAVKTFQLDPKARAGKSWRDLNKKVIDH